jgi:integrase
LKADGVICPWVFNRSNRNVKGKRITTFIKAFRAACTKAGCPGRIPHDLRRTAVRNLVRAGGPERVAMQMTGHKTRSVFERYNIVSECDLVEAAKKLNLLLFRLKAEATPQTMTGLPRRSSEAAKAGTIRAQWSPIAVPA